MRHDFFGSLKYTSSEGAQGCYWSGSIDYAGDLIELKVFTDGGSPSLKQVAFFNEVMGSLQTLVKNSSQFIEASFEIWTEKSYLENFLLEFRCKSMDIPADGCLQNDWQITFVQKSDENFVFTVFIEKGVVVCTDLDG